MELQLMLQTFPVLQDGTQNLPQLKNGNFILVVFLTVSWDIHNWGRCKLKSLTFDFFDDFSRFLLEVYFQISMEKIFFFYWND